MPSSGSATLPAFPLPAAAVWYGAVILLALGPEDGDERWFSRWTALVSTRRCVGPFLKESVKPKTVSLWVAVYG